MTPEELLKPRYKVIADYPAYPRCPYNVGDLIRAYTNDNLFYDDNGPKMSDYPHLFKKLEWWEDRKEREMPEYVKDEDGAVYKALKYYDDLVLTEFMSNKLWDKIMHYYPATEEEYINHQKTT